MPGNAGNAGNAGNFSLPVFPDLEKLTKASAHKGLLAFFISLGGKISRL
jgi:hypothetical protein